MSETLKHYRILKLTASNIKRLKAVEILPTGDVVTIGGRNDQGKSSVLDAITYACAGVGSVCEQPIRQGATKGEIVVDLGDMIITRTFKSASAPSLKVHMKDGTPVSSPQAILDALCSKISYDPMEWLRMKPDKQLEMLRQLVGVDFGPLNGKRQKLYDERTLTNRDLSQKKAKLATMPEITDAPKEEVSVSTLMGDLQALRKINEANAGLRKVSSKDAEWVAGQRGTIGGVEQDIKDSELILEKLRVRLKGENERLNTLQDSALKSKQASDAVTDEDEQPTNDKILAADTNNAKFRDNAARVAIVKEVATLTAAEASQTTAIEAVDAEKQQLLKDAKFPLPGLSFDDSGVLLDGIPFGQAGMAKKIRASVAIGLALNPKLRVILIRDGSLLDEESMKLLAETAEKEDAQVWIEVVQSKDVSVVIEDGGVREV